MLGPAAWPHSAAARVKNCRILSSHSSKQETAGTASGPQTGTTQESQAGSPSQQHSRQEQLQQQWFDQSSVYYSNYPLNRAQEQRSNEEQLTQWFNAPNARVTPVLGPKVLLTPSTTSTQPPASSSSTSAGTTPVKYQPVWVSPAADLGAALNPSVPPLFLGKYLGVGFWPGSSGAEVCPQTTEARRRKGKMQSSSFIPPSPLLSSTPSRS